MATETDQEKAAHRIALAVFLSLVLLAALCLFLFIIIKKTLRETFRCQLLANLTLALIFFGVFVRGANINDVNKAIDMTRGYCVMWWWMTTAEKVTLPLMFLVVMCELLLNIRGKAINAVSRWSMLVVPWVVGLTIGFIYLLLEDVTSIRSFSPYLYGSEPSEYQTSDPPVVFRCVSGGEQPHHVAQDLLLMVFKILGPLLAMGITWIVLLVFYCKANQGESQERVVKMDMVAVSILTFLMCFVISFASGFRGVFGFSETREWVYFGINLLGILMLILLTRKDMKNAFIKSSVGKERRAVAC